MLKLKKDKYLVKKKILVGIRLKGFEINLFRKLKVNIKNSYLIFLNKFLILKNIQLAQTLTNKILLLKKYQLKYIKYAKNFSNIRLIPNKIKLYRNRIKIEIAVLKIYSLSNNKNTKPIKMLNYAY